MTKTEGSSMENYKIILTIETELDGEDSFSGLHNILLAALSDVIDMDGFGIDIHAINQTKEG